MTPDLKQESALIRYDTATVDIVTQSAGVDVVADSYDASCGLKVDAAAGTIEVVAGLAEIEACLSHDDVSTDTIEDKIVRLRNGTVTEFSALLLSGDAALVRGHVKAQLEVQNGDKFKRQLSNESGTTDVGNATGWLQVKMLAVTSSARPTNTQILAAG